MGDTTSSQVCRLCTATDGKLTECSICHQLSCEKCWDFPVMDPKSDLTSCRKWKYKSGCIECFKSQSSLDFQQKCQIVGQNNSKEIIFIHGAGSCRKMFMPHALSLKEKGFKSILMDLPGHGSRLTEALTLENSIKAIKEALELCVTKNVTIIGGSLGGYILMQALGADPDLCWKAVVMMSGQNVGVGRSVKASIGLWAMSKSLKWLSQATVANSFISAANKNKYLDEQQIADMLKGGIYFKHGQENVALLQNGNYQESLLKMKQKIGILFINGEKDYRDSEKLYLEAAGGKSKLITYEGADHFFSHDSRFFEKLIQDISDFIQH